jgi:effector-binding domain-containing protein
MPVTSHVEPVLQSGCAQPYLAIRICLHLTEWHQLPVLATEVAAYIAQKSLKISGPLFYRYRIVGDAIKPFTLEVGYPVCTSVTGNQRIIAGAIPGGTFATLVHCGNPGMLSLCFSQLNKWGLDKGLCWKMQNDTKGEVWAGRFEFYLINPPDDLTQDKWRTAIALLIDENNPKGLTVPAD